MRHDRLRLLSSKNLLRYSNTIRFLHIILEKRMNTGVLNTTFLKKKKISDKLSFQVSDLTP